MSRATVLFLCTGNSARSQMAEGYLRRAAGGEFEALSAGVNAKGLNPLAVEAMREIGIDISRQTSKNVEQFLGQEIAYVVTVCDNAKQRCPIFPGTHKALLGALRIPRKRPGPTRRNLQLFGRLAMKL